MSVHHLDRRLFLGGLAAAPFLWNGVLAPQNAEAMQIGGDFYRSPIHLAVPTAPKDCKTCRGLGMIPIKEKDRKTYVYVEGAALPKPEDAVAVAWCDQCQADQKPEQLVEWEAERLKTITEVHKKWEDAFGAKFVYVETRHATLHTLRDARESLQMGQAIEALCAHLQKLTGTLELTLSRPHMYNLFVLWEKAAWGRYRTAAEKLYTPEQLGQSWSIARELAGYDHGEIPHFYETPLTARDRPCINGVLSFFGARQVNLASGFQRSAPWLREGFAAYSEYIVLKNVRWFSVYDAANSPPLGDSLVETRKLAQAGGLRRLGEFLKREIRVYEAGDYTQAFSLVYFLLNDAPMKFLDFCKLMREDKDKDVDAALPEAYGMQIGEIERRWGNWALNAR